MLDKHIDKGTIFIEFIFKELFRKIMQNGFVIKL